jgi:hypothetical protein
MTLGSPASAADWVYLGKSDDERKTIFVDRSSIHRTSNIVQYWQRTDYVNDKDGWKKDITFFQVDCVLHRARLLKAIAYFDDGHTSQSRGVSDWFYIVPDSIADSSEEFVCKQ